MPAHPRPSRRKPGKRPGRPPSTEGRVKLNTTLPAAVIAFLREIGEGNAAQGIRTLVYAEMARRDPAKYEGWTRERMALDD